MDKLDQLLGCIVAENQIICADIANKRSSSGPSRSSNSNSITHKEASSDTVEMNETQKTDSAAAYEMDVAAEGYWELSGAVVWQGGLAVWESSPPEFTGESDVCWDMIGSAGMDSLDTQSRQDILVCRSRSALLQYQCREVTADGSGLATQVLLKLWSVLTRQLLALPASEVRMDILLAQKNILESTNYFYEYGQRLVQARAGHVHGDGASTFVIATSLISSK